eukprot:364821-Chlamydomonas_euryale.AAC.6
MRAHALRRPQPPTEYPVVVADRQLRLHAHLHPLTAGPLVAALPRWPAVLRRNGRCAAHLAAPQTPTAVPVGYLQVAALPCWPAVLRRNGRCAAHLAAGGRRHPHALVGTLAAEGASSVCWRHRRRGRRWPGRGGRRVDVPLGRHRCGKCGGAEGVCEEGGDRRRGQRRPCRARRCVRCRTEERCR